LLFINPGKLKFRGGFLLTSPSDKFTSLLEEERIPLVFFTESGHSNVNYGATDDHTLTMTTNGVHAIADTFKPTSPSDSGDSSSNPTLSCRTLPANLEQEASPHPKDSTV